LEKMTPLRYNGYIMKKFRILIIILGIAFFLGALTVYLNRVVFPVALKKIVITQAESFLKRKVEIGSLHFNWVKGFIADKIKVSQKDSDLSFIQAERVSFGIIFIPGFKEHKITIPFINIEAPSAHLVRTAGVWNFDDLLNAASTKPQTQSAEESKSSPVSVTVTGININNGKVRIDDITPNGTLTELLDQINLNVGLSLKGITFDVSADIPNKKGMIAANGSFQPLSNELEARIKIKNIKPSDYLGFAPLPAEIKLANGLLSDVNVSVNYSKELIALKGDANLKDIDVSLNDQTFQGSVEAHRMDIDYKNGPLTAKGDFQVNGGKVRTKDLSTSAEHLKVKLDQLNLNGESIFVDADILVSKLSAALTEQRSVTSESIDLKNIKLRNDKEGLQIVGSAAAKAITALWDGQGISGDVSAKPLTVQVKKDVIAVNGDVRLDNIAASMADKSFKGNITVEDMAFKLAGAKDVDFNGKVSIDDMDVVPMARAKLTGSISLPSLDFKLHNETIMTKVQGEFNNWQGAMDGKSVVLEASFGLNLTVPLNKFNDADYAGTFTIHNAEALGFPYGPLKEISLNSEFKTDQVVIKSLYVLALEAPLKAAGSIMNFKNPIANIEIACDHIDLGKIKNAFPAEYEKFGLTTSGAASFNVNFQGLLSSPLAGKIKAHAELNNVNAESATLKQAVSNVSGTIEGTPDSLTWNNFAGTYLGKAYTLTGGLNNFKNPHIKTSLNGADVRLNVDAQRQDDLWTIAQLEGKYLNLAFSADGTVNMPADRKPTLDINAKTNFNVEDILPLLPEAQRKSVEDLKAAGSISIDASVKGNLDEWQKWTSNAKVTSPLLSVMGYKVNDIVLVISQKDQQINNLTFDALAYEGKVHAVGSGDVGSAAMPFELALNVDGLNMRKLKMDIPNLSAEEINGKLYLTTVSKGKVADILNFQAKGSVAIREGFLTEFKFFKGILGALNNSLKLGNLTFTDMESNFEISEQKIKTDNFRLISPTIVFIADGWVGFDQMCDLNMFVDMNSGRVPPIAEQVLRTFQAHFSGKITDPKKEIKISTAQVINSVLKTIGILPAN
jgi:hypothetical protein